MLAKLLKRLTGTRDDSTNTDALVTGFFDSGTRAYHDGDIRSAHQLLSNAVELDPTHAQSWYLLGVTHHKLGNLYDAALCCEQALKLDPAPQHWRESMKNLTTDLGGVDDLDKYRALADSHWVAALALGNTLRRLERLEEAEQVYRSALKRSADSPFVARRLGSLMAITRRPDEADAFFSSSAGIGLMPDQVLRLSNSFLRQIEESADSLLEQMPAMHWSPAPTDKSIVIVLSCDPGYFRKFAFAVAHSIRDNCLTDFAIHFHIVDPDDRVAEEIRALQEELGLAEVNYSWERSNAVDDSSRRTWYACARFVRLPSLLRGYRKPVWLLDLDQLVVGDVHGIVAPRLDAAPADIAMVRWHPTRWEPWEHFCASAVYAAPTAAGESFLDNTALYIAHFLGRGSPVWYLDQIALFAAYLQAKPQCVIRYIDPAAIFFVNPSMPVDPPPGAVFWTIFNSIDANAPSLEHPVFIRYAARKGRAAQP